MAIAGSDDSGRSTGVLRATIYRGGAVILMRQFDPKQIWEFFRDEKLIDGSVNVDQVVDLSFVKAAVAELGPYKPKETQ